jgi:hypothetical protein
MAVMIVEPHDGYATWLANALSGLTGRAVRVAGPDEAMAAVAAEGGAVLAALVGRPCPTATRSPWPAGCSRARPTCRCC